MAKEKEAPNPLINHKPAQKLILIDEGPNISLEEHYFWVHDFMANTMTFKKIQKIEDIFASSEASSYWGLIEQRKSLQQEKVSAFLATIGKMSKDLFMIIREIRIMDERLQYYEDSYKGDEAAEMTLKGIWIDLVEGGSKNPTSVLGLSREVGFIMLPDLFFKINPKSSSDVDASIERLTGRINRKVREVLKRKLKQFLIWKERTYKELKTGRKFKLKFLSQHFYTIRMYIDWVKPYLRNVKRLQMAERAESPEIVTAFEGSLIEIEWLATLKDPEKVDENEPLSCVKVKFEFRTRPEIVFQKEYQKGAVHVGKVKIVFEAYALTKRQIGEYKAKKEMEDFELLASINRSLDSIKEDLFKYLEQAGEKKEFFEKYFKKEKKQQPKQEKGPSAWEPFKAVYSGLSEIFGLFVKLPFKKAEKMNKWEFEQKKKKALKTARTKMYVTYDVFKKAHRMISF